MELSDFYPYKSRQTACLPQLCFSESEPKYFARRIRIRVRVGVMVMVRVRVRVICLRNSFSILLRPQHHSMLTTAGRVHTSLLPDVSLRLALSI